MSKRNKKPHSKKPKRPSTTSSASVPTTAAAPSVRRGPAASADAPAAPAASSPRQTAPPAPSSPAGSPTNAPEGESLEATAEQQRAHFALEHIQALAAEWRGQTKTQKEFNSYASAMPFMIRANGLGQTAAFYRRKGTGHVYYRLYALLGDWLAQPERPFADRSDLLEAITHSDQETYLAAQIEALLFLNWVKTLASAFLAREEEPKQTDVTEAAG
jgi:CRISPR-associated protein Cmr5